MGVNEAMKEGNETLLLRFIRITDSWFKRVRACAELNRTEHVNIMGSNTLQT